MTPPLALLLVSLALVGGIAARAAAGEVVFERDVAPIFRERCAGCHGGEEPKADLVLASLEGVLAGGKSGAAVVPGKSASSPLVDRITRRDKKGMPPAKAGKPLADAEIERIRAWIDAGAAGAAAAPEAKAKPAPPAAAAPPPDEKKPAPPSPARAASGPSPVAAVRFSPDGALLALGANRTVSVREAASGRELALLEGHADLVRALAWNAEGKVLAAAGGAPSVKGEVVLWARPDTAGGNGAAAGDAWRRLGAVEGHADAIYDVAFSPDGARLATASYDRLLKLWDARSFAEVKSFKDHIDAVFALAFLPDGARLLSAAGDRTLKLWEAESGRRVLTLSDATGGLAALAIAPGGKTVAAAGQDRMLRLWSIDGEKGALLRSAVAHDGAILALAYAPGGKSLASAAEDRLVKLWDAEKLAERLVLEPQPDWPLDVDFRPDGAAVAVGRFDGSWAVYDAASGKKLLDPAAAAAVASESDGKDGRDGTGDKDEPAPGRRRAGFLVDVVDAGNVTVPPSIDGFQPRAATRGAKLALHLNGRNLAGAELRFHEPGFKVAIVKNEAQPRPDFRRQGLATTGAEILDLSTPHKLEAEIEIAPDARPGFHRFLALTPQGATNVQSLYVDGLPEAPETEPNDTREAANPIASDRVAVGSMNRSGDEDHFCFEAAAGAELVFTLVSQSIGSGLNSLLVVLDGGGAELARSDAREFGNRAEGRVAHRFEKAGTYYLRLTDKAFGAGGHYRLTMGAFPFVTGIFPPGLQKGTAAEIAVQGFNLGGSMRIRVEAPAEVGWGATIPLPLSGAVQGASVAVGEAPEISETEPNDSPAEAERLGAPGTANGVIEKREAGKGDEDYYVFAAKAGESYLIDVVAARIGSQLDAVLSVVDANGAPVERAALRAVAHTILTLSDRDSRTQGLRLESWSDLRVNDLVKIGSEVLRIRQLPDYADEDVTFFGHNGARSGVLDTTPEYHAVGEAIYKVEAHPPGTTFPPNGMPVFKVHYQNDDGGAPVHGRDSLIHFTAPADGDYRLRVRDVQGRGGADYYYRLQVRAPRPDFQFFVGAENMNIPRGSRVPFTVSVNRLDGFNGRIEVELAEPLPAGFRLDAAPILPDQGEATLTVRAGEGAESTPLEKTFRLRARAVIDGKEVVREGSFRMLRVTGDPDMVITMEPAEVHLKAGGTAKATVHAVRRNSFAGRIPLDVPNLPHGVIVMDTGLNGILLPEGEEKRTIVLSAEPWVEAQRQTIYAIGRTETRSPLPTAFASEPSVLIIAPPEGVARRSF